MIEDGSGMEGTIEVGDEVWVGLGFGAGLDKNGEELMVSKNEPEGSEKYDEISFEGDASGWTFGFGGSSAFCLTGVTIVGVTTGVGSGTGAGAALKKSIPDSEVEK